MPWSDMLIECPFDPPLILGHLEVSFVSSFIYDVQFECSFFDIAIKRTILPGIHSKSVIDHLEGGHRLWPIYHLERLPLCCFLRCYSKCPHDLVQVICPLLRTTFYVFDKTIFDGAICILCETIAGGFTYWCKVISDPQLLAETKCHCSFETGPIVCDEGMRDTKSTNDMLPHECRDSFWSLRHDWLCFDPLRVVFNGHDEEHFLIRYCEFTTYINAP